MSFSDFKNNDSFGRIDVLIKTNSDFYCMSGNYCVCEYIKIN